MSTEESADPPAPAETWEPAAICELSSKWAPQTNLFSFLTASSICLSPLSVPPIAHPPTQLHFSLRGRQILPVSMRSSWTARKNQGPGTEDACSAEGKGSLGEAAAASELLEAASELPASGSHD